MSGASSESETTRALAALHSTLREAYWKDRNLAAVVERKEALDQSVDTRDADARGLRKAIAYDVASFCWPGWDEPGIVVDEESRALGAHAAALNLDLAEALHRPDAATAAAHWIVGTHALAPGDKTDALRRFELAASLASERATRLLCEGYASIAPGRAPATREIASLEHGGELVAQLETAARVFG